MTNNFIENHPSLWNHHFPIPSQHDHKYTRGHALIYGGYPITGAARLAARAAARIGAGLVTIAIPEKALAIYAPSLLSIMVKPLLKPKHFIDLVRKETFAAFLIGPGAGQKILAPITAILETQKPTVLDADALTAFEGKGKELFKRIKGTCILTPHEGEFARLFSFKGEKCERAQEAAKLSQAIVVLKGSTTVIAAPDGRMVVNKNAPPTLASAGTGDVLSGIITGLLAQRMAPFEAACAGVWLHSEAANVFGLGLLAEDLPDLLPKVVNNPNIKKILGLNTMSIEN